MKKIANYEVLDIIRAGPRPLYEAKAPDGRVIALKTIAVEQLSETIRARFLREASMCADFDHPNLVRVFDSGEADGVLYQAMDLLEGSDLSQVLAERRPLSWEQKLSIMEEVCDGLAYAHDRKLIHRDIKPANVFLETSGRVKLLDFGMARPDTSELTQVGSAVGTLNYMAPEQIRAEGCTTASDVFSAGILFYQLASGRHPFSGRDSGVAQIVSAILFEAPKPLSEVVPDAPDGIQFVIAKALEKDPAKRWRSAAAFRQALIFSRLTIAPASPVAGGDAEEPSRPPVDATVLVPRRQPSPADPVKAAPPPGAAPAAPPAGRPAVSADQPRPAAGQPPAARLPLEDFVYCFSCTSRNTRGASFCSVCGVPLTSVAAPVPGGAVSRRRLIAAGIAAAVVLVVLMAVIYVATTR